jgi:hypothetical protein
MIEMNTTFDRSKLFLIFHSTPAIILEEDNLIEGFDITVSYFKVHVIPFLSKASLRKLILRIIGNTINNETRRTEADSKRQNIICR